MQSSESKNSLAAQKTPCRVGRQDAFSRFAADERLFRRVPPEAIVDNHPAPQSFVWPISVNRSNFSKEICAVCDRIVDTPVEGFAVASMTVAALPKCEVEGYTFGTDVVHTPTKANYSHSELFPVPDKGAPFFTHARKRLKQLIADAMIIVPDVPTCEDHRTQSDKKE
jgi:hypothetical protein